MDEGAVERRTYGGDEDLGVGVVLENGGEDLLEVVGERASGGELRGEGGGRWGSISRAREQGRTDGEAEDRPRATRRSCPAGERRTSGARCAERRRRQQAGVSRVSDTRKAVRGPEARTKATGERGAGGNARPARLPTWPWRRPC